MTCRILVVEDEIFVATEIEHVIGEMGYATAGIAPDKKSAMALATETDVALVDLNLRDGPTGKAIGEALAQSHGITVLFMTANPTQLGDGVPGTIGVLPKPVTDSDLRAAVTFAVAQREAGVAIPPRRLQLFEQAE
jgi:DNA-binding response OmpR family regulator